MHGCENILNPIYIAGVNDQALFDEQSKFMYDAFLMIVQTPIMMKNIVRNHEDTNDVQSVWCEYSIHMHMSTQADIEIENLMGQLTTL